MKKLKYGIGTILIIGIIVGSIPYITKNSIDNTIQEKQIELRKYGIALNVISNIGYISNKREIEVKIQDTIKFIDNISNILEIDVQTLNELTNNGKFLENLSFTGRILNRNFFPEYANISLSFDEVPTDLKQMMREKPIINNLIKLLSLKLKVDLNGDLTFIALNDIVIIDEDITAKILKPQMIINKNHYLTSIQNITFQLDDERENILIYLDDIKDALDYKDSLNFNEITTINNLKFNYKNNNPYNNSAILYTSENNNITVNSHSENDELNIVTQYNIGNSYLNTIDVDTKIENLTLKLGFEKLKEQPIQELMNNKTSSEQFLNILEPRLQEIINYGFSMNLESNINNINNSKSNNFEAKNININLLAKLKRNNLNKNSSPDKLAENILVTGLIKMDKHIIDSIIPMQKYNTNIINGIANFDIKFIDGKLLINEHKVN